MVPLEGIAIGREIDLIVGRFKVQR